MLMKQHTYIVTVWAIGDVYVGNNADAARKMHDWHWRQVLSGQTHGMFPICVLRDGETAMKTTEEGTTYYEQGKDQ